LKRCRLRRISRRWQFNSLFRNGSSYWGSVIKAKFKRNALGCIRLGFSVSAKKGNAVQRNLFRRRLRQYSAEAVVEQGYDAVIFPLLPLKDTRWADMKQDMEALSKRAKKDVQKG
jgi:ribonuclease P protein component